MKMDISKFFVVTKTDESVHVIYLYEGESIEQEIAKWPDALKNEVVSHLEISPNDIPSDRYFRSAWKLDNGTIQIDMEKAREVHMNKIRVSRDEKLKELDIETMKGKDVQAEKQVLRDITKTLDLSSAITPDELKNIWPDELK